MNIKNITSNVKMAADITISFDDGTNPTYTIAEGEQHSITYLNDAKIITATGKIKKIHCFNIKNCITGFTPSPGLEIIMDCSAQYEEKSVTIYSNTIRGIDDTKDKYKDPEPIQNATVITEASTQTQDGYGDAYDPSNPGNTTLTSSGNTNANTEQTITDPSK